jgi:tetratricopeptide (TPR) repeat protein
MSEKLTKEELKTDLFIQFTDRILSVLEKNWKTLSSILLAITLAGLAYVGYTYKLDHNEKTAQKELYQIRQEMDKAESTYKARDVNNQNETEFNTHFEPVIKKFNLFFAKHRKTRSERIAIIELADLYSSNNQLEKAKATLTMALPEVTTQDFYYGSMAIKLSQVLMDQEEFKEAIKVLEKLSGVPDQKHFHAESLFRIGISYDKLQDTEKAKQYLERVDREFSETESAKNAKIYLRYLIIKGST